MSNNGMVKEAQSIIKGIRQFQSTATDRLANVDKQIEDLKKAQRIMAESVTKGPIQTHGGDEKLKGYVNNDGTLQLKTQKRNISIPGHGSVQAEVEGILDAKIPANEWHRDLIQKTQERAWCRSLMTSPHTPKTDLAIHKLLQRAPREIKDQVNKAFYDGAGVGAEWIPDEFKAELYETFTVPRNLRGLLPMVQMSGNTLLLPRMNRGGRPYIKGQVTTDSPANYTASTIETAQASIAVKGFATRYVLDDSASEDSALAVLPILSRQISADLESAWEDCFINGDTTAVHGDAIGSWNIRSRWGSSGLGGADDHRRAFMGLRHRALDLSTDLNGTPGGVTTAQLVSGIGQMGELGVGNVMCIVSPEAMVKHLMGNSDLLTIDKFGSLASLVNGQIASLFGFPVIMSRFIGADMAANGLYTGAGSQTGILFFNQGSWAQYQRRGVTVETDKDIASGSIEIVSTLRNIAATADAATTKNVSYIRDLNS